MEIEQLKEPFTNFISNYDFVAKYQSFDKEYSERDWKTLDKVKVSDADIKKLLKEVFNKYNFSHKHGGFYLEKNVLQIGVTMFFQVKANIFSPYLYIYDNSGESPNAINNDNGLVNPSSIVRFLLNDPEYPFKSKIFKNIEEFKRIISHEVAFYEKLVNDFFIYCDYEGRI